jgi:hypothetical protein
MHFENKNILLPCLYVNSQVTGLGPVFARSNSHVATNLSRSYVTIGLGRGGAGTNPEKLTAHSASLKNR